MKLRQGNIFTSVCDSVHGGGGFSVGGSLSRGGFLSGGVSVQGGSLSKGVSVRETPPQPYGYVRTVRILLECILVLTK